MIDFAKIGSRVKVHRVGSGMSQEALAEASGTSRVFISNIERGLKCPSLEVLINIANALKVTTDILLADCLDAMEASGAGLIALLDDCTVEEAAIILRLLAELKDILRDYRIG